MKMLDDVIGDRVSMAKAVRFYESEGDPAELVQAARTERYRGYALDILAELPGRVRGDLWKSIVLYTSDPDARNACAALEIVADDMGDGDCALLLEVLDRINHADEVVFAKACAVTMRLGEALVEKMLLHTLTDKKYRTHTVGLMALTALDDRRISLVAEMVEAAAHPLKLYLTALLARRYFEDAKLAASLPPMVREDVELDAKYT